MVTIAVIVVHIVLSVLLILSVLLHSGRGGGLSDMFGGGVGAAAAGSSVAERNLDRITIALGVAWVFTTATLAIRFQ